MDPLVLHVCTSRGTRHADFQHRQTDGARIAVEKAQCSFFVELIAQENHQLIFHFKFLVRGEYNVNQYPRFDMADAKVFTRHIGASVDQASLADVVARCCLVEDAVYLVDDNVYTKETCDFLVLPHVPTLLQQVLDTRCVLYRLSDYLTTGKLVVSHTLEVHC